MPTNYLPFVTSTEVPSLETLPPAAPRSRFAPPSLPANEADDDPNVIDLNHLRLALMEPVDRTPTWIFRWGGYTSLVPPPDASGLSLAAKQLVANYQAVVEP